MRLRTWYTPEVPKDDLFEMKTFVVPRAKLRPVVNATDANNTVSSNNLTMTLAELSVKLEQELQDYTTDNHSDDANTTKVSWEGELIPNGPWIDRELFKIGNITITNKDVVVSTGVTLAIALGVVSTCSYISWRNRKAIAAGARRASEYVRNSVKKIRQSFSGAPPDENPRRVSDVIPGKQQQNFFKDLNKERNA